MNNILLLTDFSELSEYAKNLANKIVKGLNSQLHILSVVETPSEILVTDEGELQGGMSSETKGLISEKQEAIRKLEGWKQNLPVSTKSSVLFGELLYTIKHYIKNNNIDLVIMGTHGVTGLKEKFSGSVTQQVILNNRVPVLSLKCDRGDVDFSDFLITGDFESKEVMDFGVLKALQKVFNSKMHLLCVSTKSKFKSTANALEKMKGFAAINELENVEFHIHNDVSEEEGILNFSNNYDANHELNIDIVAVEKKDKSTLEHWFTGCAAIDYVNHIYRPIITYLTK